MYRLAPREILTERLSLRPLGPEHASLVFYTYASKPEVARYLAWTPHREVEETFQFLRQCELGWQAGQVFNYGIWLHSLNRLIGSIGLHQDLEGRFNLGYALTPTAWGKGLATEAACGLLDAWSSKQGPQDYYSFVHPENASSARVLEKAGFQLESAVLRTFVFPNAENREIQVKSYHRHR